MYLLPFVFLVVLGIYFRSRRGVLSTCLRFLCLSSLILALSDPFYSAKNATATNKVTALIDQSASMTDEAIRSCLRQLKERSKDKDKPIEVRFFSNEIGAAVSLNGDDSLVKIPRSKNIGLTNFQTSLLDASLKFAGDELVVCTDGKETAGDISNIYSEIANSFHSISLLFPDPNSLSIGQIEISNLSLPIEAKKSDKISIGFGVKNHLDSKIGTAVEILIDEKLYKSVPVNLDNLSEKKFDMVLDEMSAGFHKVTVRDSKGTSQGIRWIKVNEPPSVILVSKQGSSSALIEKLLKALNTNFKTLDPKDLETIATPNKENTAGIILNNIRATDLSKKSLNNISTFVSGGGGLIILGGDSSFGIGAYQNTVLDLISPLKSVPPRSKVARAPSAIMLVIDKSGSMGEQGKLHAAKLAALSSIYSLKPDDFVGIVAFDYAPLSIVELDTTQNIKANVKERLANLTAYGQTNLLPALSLARLRLSKINAGKKHLIILSDGQFPPSSDAFVAEINRLRSEGITISTVALGYEADGPFMKMLAQAGKGSFYQTVDASSLPKLFVDDIKLAVGEDTMKEESSYHLRFGDGAGALIKFGVPPDLLGFVETEAKPNSEVQLVTDKDKASFPILASWKYESGIVIAFASDLQGRWTSPWLRWNEFLNFWETIIRKTIKRGEESLETKDLDIRYEISGGLVKLEAFIYDKYLVDKIGSSIGAEAGVKDKPAKKFQMLEMAKGRFEGSVNLDATGDYDIKFDFDHDKSFRISLLPQDLGETIGGGVDFSFLNKIKEEIGANLGEIKYSLIEKSGNIKKTRSAPIIIPLLFVSIICLVLEVCLREKRKNL